jgi:dolichol-phosphate mannosyltransferase
VSVTLSVVVPLYNEELVIDEMYRRLTAVLESSAESYEIVLVNDGSRDRTLELAEALCKRDTRVKLVGFSRNFGHQIAITAGMDKSSGACVVVIDADLQDPPEVILRMLAMWRNEGYKIVYGVRQSRRGDSWFKRTTAQLFYRLLRKLTSIEIPVDTGDFRLIDRAALGEFLKMREHARYVRGMVSWIGFKQGAVYYERNVRFAGETKYPLRKMVRFGLDGMLSFSHLPLRIASMFGFLSSGISFVFMTYGLIVRNFFPAYSVPGWASTFSAILFLGGVQLICLGVLGEYVGRIYEEVKQRPLYVIEKQLNF